MSQILTAVKNIAILANSIDESTSPDSSKGEKISLGEGFTISKSAVTAITGIAKNWQAIKEEKTALTPEAKQQILAEFAAEFDLKNDVAESIIEDAVSILVGFESIIKQKNKI